MIRIRAQIGYTLVEVVMVIIILGILATVAFRPLAGALDVARTEETRREMDRLAFAVAGNPALVSGGIRTDFGYVGDIGSLPPSWDALAVNPGYATWRGPYLSDEFSGGPGDIDFKLDAWDRPYSSPNNCQFNSTGGPETITRTVARSIDDLLYNRVTVFVADLDGTPPGAGYRDSIRLALVHPDGAGGLIARTTKPDAGGLAHFDSVPIGIHMLEMIYLPDNDTIRRKIAVNPGRTYHLDLQHFGDVW